MLGIVSMASACSVFCILAFGPPGDAIVHGGQMSGSFSNVCLHPETGDLLGEEVSFIPSSGGLRVLFQKFEGVPLLPVLTAPLSSDRDKVEVRHQEVAFTATLLGDQLRLTFTDGQVGRAGLPTERLVRRAPVWSDAGVSITGCK